jgi:hypothetical protein
MYFASANNYWVAAVSLPKTGDERVSELSGGIADGLVEDRQAK